MRDNTVVLFLTCSVSNHEFDSPAFEVDLFHHEFAADCVSNGIYEVFVDIAHYETAFTNVFI